MENIEQETEEYTLWDYIKNGCPVIDEDVFNRVILRLPSREEVNEKTKSDTHIIILDGDEDKHVIFDWDEEADGWRLRNKVIAYPNNGNITSECTTCKKVTDQIVNNDITKKKCKVCSTITPIEI